MSSTISACSTPSQPTQDADMADPVIESDTTEPEVVDIPAQEAKDALSDLEKLVLDAYRKEAEKIYPLLGQGWQPFEDGFHQMIQMQ